MNISGIYQIQSKNNPKRIYIGSASNIRQRWNGHLCSLRKNKHHSLKLQNHYNKYGESDLQFSILLGCENDKEYLIKTEQFFIDSYKPYFNNCPLAKSRKGSKASEETRIKNSKALLGNKYTLGYKHSLEFCKKSSDNRKKNWQDPEYRKKVSEGLKRSHAERGKNNNSIQGLRKALSMSHTPEANAKRTANMKETIRLKKLNKFGLITNN